MNAVMKSLPFATVLVLAGCGYSTKGYRYQGPSFPPREANCPLEIFTTPPKTPGRLLAVVEFKPRGLGKAPQSEIEAREKVQPYACQAGGDAVIIAPGADGRYAKATILRIGKAKKEKASK